MNPPLRTELTSIFPRHEEVLMAAGGTWFVDPVLLVDSIQQGVDKVHGKLTATAYCSC